jgi:hypothetical protein
VVLSDEQLIDQVRAELRAGLEILKPSQELLEAVDEFTREKGRTRSGSLERPAGRDRRRWRVRFPRLGATAAVLAVVIVAVVVAAIALTVRHQSSTAATRPQAPASHGVVTPPQSQVIRNFSPERPPALPGRAVCTADLTRPGLAPGGLAWKYSCQSQMRLRSPMGTFRGNVAKPGGVVEYRFSITASGLRPNTAGSVYAVWLLQAAPQGGKLGSYRLLKPQMPQLLGVIEPGVGRDGRLAAECSMPRSLLGSAYLLLITLQPHQTTASPGRTVLRGFISLPNAGS